MALWIKIATAVFAGLMIVLLLPVAKRMYQESPAAKPGDWQAAIIPLLLIALFVAFLIKYG